MTDRSFLLCDSDCEPDRKQAFSFFLPLCVSSHATWWGILTPVRKTLQTERGSCHGVLGNIWSSSVYLLHFFLLFTLRHFFSGKDLFRLKTSNRSNESSACLTQTRHAEIERLANPNTKYPSNLEDKLLSNPPPINITAFQSCL